MRLPAQIEMRVDNKQAEVFQKGTCVSTKLVGVYDMREDWIQELRDQTVITTTHVSGQHNKADVLTKCMSSGAFNSGVGLVQGG